MKAERKIASFLLDWHEIRAVTEGLTKFHAPLKPSPLPRLILIKKQKGEGKFHSRDHERHRNKRRNEHMLVSDKRGLQTKTSLVTANRR